MSDKEENVLLVLPESTERSKLSLLMRELGSAVHLCPDPHEAVRVMGSNRYGMAIVDYEQPGFSGIEVIKQFNRIRARSRIVLLAPGDLEGKTPNAYEIGAIEIIFRPIAVGELMKRIKVILSKPIPPYNKSLTTSHPFEMLPKRSSLPQAPAKRQSSGTVMDETYRPSFLAAKSTPGYDFLQQIWSTRMFDSLITITGEEGSEFELAVRELNAASGSALTFPYIIKYPDLQDTEYLNNLNAKVELRGVAGGIALIQDATQLEPQARAHVLDFIRKKRNQQKCHLRLALGIIGNEEDYDSDVWSWVMEIKTEAEANLSISPMRNRQADVVEYVRKLFYDMTTLHHNLPVREIEEPALDCLRTYKWPGNFDQIVCVIRSAVANCPARSMALHHVEPMLKEAQ
ncbi:MAG: response regulator, partial [Verrucomicrobiota bacterium]